MRQWMVNPAHMCRRHLLGEHAEHHMFVAALDRSKSVKGYLKNNLLEPKSLLARHEALATEMLRRGYSHRSPLRDPSLDYLPKDALAACINRGSAEKDLFERCEDCRMMGKR